MRNDANVLIGLKKIPLYTMLILGFSVPLKDNLQAKNMSEIAINKELTNIEQQQNTTQNDIDKQIEAYYQRLITTPGYEYTDVFKKVWKERRESSLWNDIYKDCVVSMVRGNPPERLAIDVLIITFGQGKINKDIEKKIMNRLAEKKTDIYYMKQMQKLVQLGFQLMQEEVKLAEIKELNKQLGSVIESLEGMNKLFKEKQEK